MNPNLSIRPFQATDESDLIALWVDCGLVVPENDPLKDIQRKGAVNPEWFLIGELDGQIVASCMAGYEGHRGWINYLAVAPDHRNEGFARKIMEHAEALLRKSGCPKINLQIRETNSQAIEFYKKIGYSQDPVISMGKRLEEDCQN